MIKIKDVMKADAALDKCLSRASDRLKALTTKNAPCYAALQRAAILIAYDPNMPEGKEIAIANIFGKRSGVQKCVDYVQEVIKREGSVAD